MTVTTEINEFNIYDELWSGGRSTLDDLTVSEVAEILEMVEDCNCGNSMSITELNDFFWFERDIIAEWLGYEDYEELMNR
jgi:hypothetical protein